jgi:hypothetical protein
VGGEQAAEQIQQGNHMSYIQKLVAGGAVAVGLSADWVNAAYRIEGNEDAGTVVFENDSRELELIEYTHNEDGERVDVVVSRVPDITPELFAAYVAQAGLADASSGGHDPVGCLEIAAGLIGLEIYADDERDHSARLVCDMAAWCDTLLECGGWHVCRSMIEEANELGAVTVGEGMDGIVFIGHDGEPVAFVSPDTGKLVAIAGA